MHAFNAKVQNSVTTTSGNDAKSREATLREFILPIRWRGVAWFGNIYSLIKTPALLYTAQENSQLTFCSYIRWLTVENGPAIRVHYIATSQPSLYHLESPHGLCWPDTCKGEARLHAKNGADCSKFSGWKDFLQCSPWCSQNRSVSRRSKKNLHDTRMRLLK